MWNVDVDKEGNYFLRYRSPTSSAARVMLISEPPLDLEQWRLIRSQFNNMNIVPRRDHQA